MLTSWASSRIYCSWIKCKKKAIYKAPKKRRSDYHPEEKKMQANKKGKTQKDYINLLYKLWVFAFCLFFLHVSFCLFACFCFFCLCLSCARQIFPSWLSFLFSFVLVCLCLLLFAFYLRSLCFFCWLFFVCFFGCFFALQFLFVFTLFFGLVFCFSFFCCASSLCFLVEIKYAAGF